MQIKTFLSAAVAVAIASAQNATTANLTSVLGSNSNLTALGGILAQYPDITASLANATNITLFAPSNQALANINSTLSTLSSTDISAFINALLSYHVLQGEYYAANITETPAFPHTTLNNTVYSNVTGGQVVECRLSGTTVEIVSGLKTIANVTEANLNFTGGVVHVIDSVLVIPTNISTTASAANLTAFLGAVNATGLTSTLDGLSDVTVFAPSNSAFQDIASGLGNLSTSDLTGILSYHVVNGTVAYSSSLVNGSVIPTLGGGNVTVTITNGSVFVNSARVVNSDVLVSGGVIHIIDSVLNPNNTAAANGTSDSTSPSNAYAGASSQASVPFTSGQPTPTVTVTNLIVSTTAVAAGFTSAAGGGAAGGAGASSSSSAAAAGSLPTGVIGAAALFGGAAIVANF